MARILRCLAVGLVVLLALDESSAQAQCNSTTAWDHRVQTSAVIQGTALQFVQMSAYTAHDPGDPCHPYVQSEAWVNPGGTPAVAQGTPAVWASAVKYGNLWGIQSGSTKHWYIYRNETQTEDVWHYKGSITLSVDLGVPPPPDRQDTCEAMGGTWDAEFRRCIFVNSPIVIDVEGNGYRLTSAAEGVFFDLDGVGAVARIGWTSPDSDDAFLALDRNGNTIIDDGSELFGTGTRRPDGAREPNGFVALAHVDPAAALDGVINEADPIYHRLLLWTDRNHNGFSESGELIRLGSAGVTAIFLGYEQIGRRDPYGNRLRYMGAALVRKHGVERPRHVYDVFFTR